MQRRFVARHAVTSTLTRYETMSVSDVANDRNGLDPKPKQSALACRREVADKLATKAPGKNTTGVERTCYGLPQPLGGAGLRFFHETVVHALLARVPGHGAD